MIIRTGGMIGLRTGPEAAHPHSAVDNRCGGSSRSFAQSLIHAVDNGLTVGFGADLNGFIKQLKPRYRWDACPQDASEIASAGGPSRLQAHGLGHIGMLPELIDDLRAVGVPEDYLAHLNRSAEAFLQMWERSVSLSQSPTCSAGGNRAPEGSASASSTFCWGSDPGEHCYSPARINDGDASTTLGGLHSWANADGVPLPQWVELTWPVELPVSRVDLYTSDGYPLQDYRIEYWDGSQWSSRRELEVFGNTNTYRRHDVVPAINTRRLRVLGLRGPSHQPNYVRVNELEVY